LLKLQHVESERSVLGIFASLGVELLFIRAMLSLYVGHPIVVREEIESALGVLNLFKLDYQIYVIEVVGLTEDDFAERVEHVLQLFLVLN